ncbi:hypothetical protein OIU35_00960 [Boseaceae bacterium BT-24-1]|nr:hypothetical protein [Boseaceae bacterium BT-24-1]
MLPYYVRRQRQLAIAYASIVAALSLACFVAPLASNLEAAALGAMAPGAGFLQWAAGDQILLAIGWTLVSFGLFVMALILWFATGNLIAPVAIWGLLALSAAQPEWFALDRGQISAGWQFALAPALAVAAVALAWRKREKARHRQRAASVTSAPAPVPFGDELSIETLQRLRLLLDRALQPSERFDGFEWRDQFQTAAVRYQVNFVSYALALARANYAPAADAYFLTAQQSLLTKIGDRRLWRYWRMENAWGNLRLDPDPVPHQNIMYSGFTALQIGIGGSCDDLVLHDKGATWRRYAPGDIASALAGQYAKAPYGLVACEPNWIYPLCNIITMAGLRAIDVRAGTDHWPGLADRFLDSLDREATSSDGSFIAFRSALTGIAPPAPGGIVMQAFPALFLNALSPELAWEHWARVRQRLDAGDWWRLFWPVDVGNYGFSRAAGYAGTAAAAVELGDAEVAAKCLARLEDECRSHSDRGTIHRESSSLWAHACELIALCGRPNGLRNLVEGGAVAGGPRLVAAPYPVVLVAKAQSDGRSLELVLHPGDGAGSATLEFGGLRPDCVYSLGRSNVRALKSDGAGHAVLRVFLAGRTMLTLEPTI